MQDTVAHKENCIFCDMMSEDYKEFRKNETKELFTEISNSLDVITENAITHPLQLELEIIKLKARINDLLKNNKPFMQYFPTYKSIDENMITEHRKSRTDTLSTNIGNYESLVYVHSNLIQKIKDGSITDKEMRLLKSIPSQLGEIHNLCLSSIPKKK